MENIAKSVFDSLNRQNNTQKTQIQQPAYVGCRSVLGTGVWRCLRVTQTVAHFPFKCKKKLFVEPQRDS